MCDAAIYTLYVVDVGATPEAGTQGLYDTLEEAGQRAIDEVVAMAESAGVEPVEGWLARGTPYDTILDYAADDMIDLIVMGTHGRSGLERYLLGSVTERVIRLAEVPVLTVRIPGGSGG